MLGEEVIIYDGLKSGEQIATSGSFKLREAVLVAMADPSQGRAPTQASRPIRASQADSSRKE